MTEPVWQLDIGDVRLWVKGEDPMYHAVIPEILHNYDFDAIEFRKGDVVLDVGAHVGLAASYCARHNPQAVIHSYEPVPELYAKLVWGLRQNEITNVIPHKLAVTCDGRNLTMRRGTNTAEATAFFPSAPHATGEPFTVRSTSIPRILKKYGIKRVRLLKLDCEGAEHEILANSDGWMDRVDYVRGEIHIQPDLLAAGYTEAGTKARVPAGKINDWMVVY